MDYRVAQMAVIFSEFEDYFCYLKLF